MKLGKILEGVAEAGKWAELEVTDIVSDSRKVKKGSVFVAYKGVAIDGHDFVEKAVGAGAVVVVGEKPLKLAVPYFQVGNGRLVWAKMVANYYDNPEKKLAIIGVTGTDGKTTTTNLIYEFLKAAGKKVSMVSTIKAVVAGREFDTGLHTSSPDPDMLWPWLSEAVKAGDKYFVLEATSHGLAQYRLGDIVFEVGVLTNLAHDHLEFHGTIEAYRDAKAMLFERSKRSVLNKCSKEFDYFAKKAMSEVIPYDVKTEIRNVNYVESEDSVTQELEMKIENNWVELTSFFLGDYNLENILAAAKAVVSLGVQSNIIVEVLRKFKNLAGRFQVVPNDRGFRTIVDFAHTEQGVRSVTNLVRQHLRKGDERIIAIFGCNGERDQTKRAPMGKVACGLADLVVVTTEDPRRESVEQIYKQIEEGCIARGGVLGETFFRVDDRKEAIDFAINELAKKGDWVLFLGKGHEQSMNIGGTEYPWDEVSIVKEVLNK